MDDKKQTRPAGSANERDIFLAALEQPTPEARVAYLISACGGDPALRAAVESLLKHHQEDSFLESSAPGADSTLRRAEPVVAEGPGSMIGRYKLLQQIGEGGCGVVYMAEQQEPVRRQVALKVIKLGLETKNVLARFEAERQALALMDHPNIAKVFDAGATQTGRPYFVMELVRGTKITDYCDENKVPTRERLGLFRQVCDAIQHAHQKGVIHRDIKPANVLVTLRDGVPVPKVIDFGIAKATTGQRLTDKTLFTAFEQFIGTPDYMSPEQAEMSEVGIDTRSDIYSMGVLLYELLTGHTPFDTKALLAAGLDELRRTIREVEPVKPSTRLTQKLVAADVSRRKSGRDGTVSADSRRRLQTTITLLRGDLDWIVMKCLEKDRERRYETANGLAMDVQRYLADEAVVACPPSNLYRIQKLVRRNKLTVTAASAVVAALLIGLGISTWMFFKEKAARERAVTAEKEQSRLRQQAEAAEQTAKSEAGKSQQVAKFLTDMLASVGPSVAQGRDTKLLREILDKTAQRVANNLTNQPAVGEELRCTLANVYEELGDYEQAEKLQREALALQEKLFGHEHVRVASSLNYLGTVLARQSKFREAEASHREALALNRKLRGDKHREVAVTLNNLGNALWSQGRTEDAAPLYREALSIFEGSASEESVSIAGLQGNLAMLAQRRGNLLEAEEFFRKSGLLASEWVILTDKVALEAVFTG